MPHLELALLDELLDLVAELEQAQQVADGGARTTDRVRGRLVRHLEFADQAVEGARFLERIQVLALDVLDQRHRDRGFVGHAAESRPGCRAGPPSARLASVARRR